MRSAFSLMIVPILLMATLSLYHLQIEPRVSSKIAQKNIQFNLSKEQQIINLYIKYYNDNNGDTGLFPQNIDDLITQGKSDNLLLANFDKKNFLGNDYEFAFNEGVIELNSSVPPEYTYERIYNNSILNDYTSESNGEGLDIDILGREYNLSKTPNNINSSDINASLILHYTFDNVLVNTVYDESLKANDGTLINHIISNGYVGNGMEIVPGNDNGINLTNVLEDTEKEFTMIFYMKLNSKGNVLPIFSDLGEGVNYIAIHGGTNQVEYAPTTLINSNGRENYTFNQDEWYNVAITFKGSTLNMYVNGVLIHSHTYLNSDKNNLNITKMFTSNSAINDSGVIDELKIYNRELSETDINKVIKLPPSAGLILHYTFDNFTGNDLNDETGNYDITLSGVTTTQGVFENALNANGSDAFQIVNPFTNSDDVFTISYWIKVPSINPYAADHPYIIDNSTIFNSRAEGIIQILAYHGGTNNLTFLQYLEGYSTVHSSYPQLMNYNLMSAEMIKDEFVNIIYNKNLTEINIYMNGILMKTSTKIENTNYPLHSATLSFFGKNDDINNATYKFKLLIDDIRFYNRSLNEEEVEALSTLRY
jgi:hypothetical protein